MITSDKFVCRAAAEILVRHGVRRVVVSPGSRNTPLIMAFERDRRLDVTIVVDERAAAFVALGMAVESGEPVALACTSGTAPLNYAPALAEAYYRNMPLIALTADRPVEWINQDDSQTIRQPGALANIVKSYYDLPVEGGDGSAVNRLIERRLNDAVSHALAQPRGPVHINVQLDEPLSAETERVGEKFKHIEIAGTCRRISDSALDDLACRFAQARRVAVVAGFMPHDSQLGVLAGRMAALPGVVVFTEVQSNIDADGCIGNIDATLCAMGHMRDAYVPDLVITVGGSLVSRMIKEYLRSHADSVEHWSVGLHDHAVDCFGSLTTRIDVDAITFINQLLPRIADSRNGDTAFACTWQAASARALSASASYANAAPWSDFVAMAEVHRLIPREWHVHYSNGTAVRYGQLFAAVGARRECNRGVSGIDGCTSTAIGAAMGADDATILLISGDMSASYDSGAFAIADIPPTFKMIVLNNGGGGIFRFIKTTRALPELDRCLAADVRLPLRDIAAGYGFDYYEVADAESLRGRFAAFAAPSSRPAIMNIITPGALSAEVLTDYFKSFKIQDNNDTA